MNAREAIYPLAAALCASRAPLIFGLQGISMENQRRSVRLAAKLGACVSVERPDWAENGLFSAGGSVQDEPLWDNRAGACQVLLEEAGGYSARFTQGVPSPDPIFSADALLRAGAADCALLIGTCSALPQGLGGSVPLYVLGGAEALKPRAATFVPAAAFWHGEGGTALRQDGVPVTVPAGEDGGAYRLSELLDALLAEVSEC